MPTPQSQNTGGGHNTVVIVEYATRVYHAFSNQLRFIKCLSRCLIIASYLCCHVHGITLTVLGVAYHSYNNIMSPAHGLFCVSSHVVTA